MGGLVSGLFDLFGGDPTAKERGAIGDLYGYETGKGENALNQGLDFYSAIQSGDPATIARVLAPEIKSGQNMVQQQAEQNAFFGNRGGGTNASTNAAQSNERGNIIDLIGQLQGGSANALTGAGENLVGQGAENIMNSAGLAAANRRRVTGDVGGIANSVAQIATGLPFGGGGGGGDPYATLYQASHPDRTSIGLQHVSDPFAGFQF